MTSSFGYFPGLPIYHSRDLVNWQQIGNAIQEIEHFPVVEQRISRGLFAPTIRYHNGIFYIVCTNVSSGGNFIIETTDPAGYWGEPSFLEDAPGIDPSLFFDEDGRCYYIGTRPNSKGEAYYGDWEIWLQEFDVNRKDLIGSPTPIWNGAMKNVVWPEGPHLYKINDYYYLLNSEGGTGQNHCITIARSKQITGPYEGYKNNPILTHRHLGKDFPIQNVGHADLFETPEGEWYLVCLASRMLNGADNLGRESFLAKVDWENDWPVVNKGFGYLHAGVLTEIDKDYCFEEDTFSGIKKQYLWINQPDLNSYDFSAREDWLRISPSNTLIESLGSPTYMGIRQKDFDYELSTRLDFSKMYYDGYLQEAGLVIYQNHENLIKLVAYQDEYYNRILLYRIKDGKKDLVGEFDLEKETDVILEIRCHNNMLSAHYIAKNKSHLIGNNVDVSFLSTNYAGGFVGTTLGVYAFAHEADRYADFHYLKYMDSIY